MAGMVRFAGIVETEQRVHQNTGQAKRPTLRRALLHIQIFRLSAFIARFARVCKNT